MRTRVAGLRRITNRRGAMLVFVAVSMVGLLGVVALAVDVGVGNRQRRIAQTAADAGALGGGMQIYRQSPDSASIVAAAFDAANRNGFPGGEVTVVYPPASGNHVGDYDYIEVLIAKSVPTVFGRIFSQNNFDIKARAVAGLGTASNNCVYSLASSGNGIDVEGDMFGDCGFVANSDIYVKKNIDAPSVSAVGDVDGGPSGSTYEGVPPAIDPYATLTVPTFDGTCEYTNLVVASDQTLSPGDYCGGLKVNKNIKATLNPGTYIMRGGGIDGGQIVGTGGVTLINAVSTDNDPLKFKPFVFGNNCAVNIVAPTSGAFAGIAIFQDRNGPVANNATEWVNDVCGKGGGNNCMKDDEPDITGVVYFPTQTFSVGNSNGKFTVNGTLIAKYIAATNGGAKFCMFLDTTGDFAPKRLSLVE